MILFRNIIKYKFHQMQMTGVSLTASKLEILALFTWKLKATYLHRALWVVNYRIQKWTVRVYKGGYLCILGPV